MKRLGSLLKKLEKMLDVNLGDNFLGFNTKSKSNKSKNKQVGLC